MGARDDRLERSASGGDAQPAADAEPAREAACIAYERPELEVFGSLHDLTRGAGGNAADSLFGSLVQ